jgi:hypothetical protein
MGTEHPRPLSRITTWLPPQSNFDEAQAFQRGDALPTAN